MILLATLTKLNDDNDVYITSEDEDIMDPEHGYKRLNKRSSKKSDDILKSYIDNLKEVKIFFNFFLTKN